MTLDFVLRWLTVLFLIIFNIFSATVIEDYIKHGPNYPCNQSESENSISDHFSTLYDVTKKGYP